MALFGRGVTRESMLELQKLASSTTDNWWKEVLGAKELLLAVRNGYLNAYAKGQSVFKIEFEKTNSGAVRPLPAIHYKYLIKPTLEKDPYVAFDGAQFAIDPADIVHTMYQSKLTLPHLIKTAARFAGAEKSGVHTIALKEPKIVDLEVALTATGQSESPSAPRMDIAVLVPDAKGGASLVFCEAKCFDNRELWSLETKVLKDDASERKISVVAQIDKYQAFIRSVSNREELARAYVKVCKTLVALGEQDPHRKCDELINRVATGEAKLTIHPNVYLLVYGFDDDQKKGALAKRLKALRESGIQIIAKGKPSDFSLAKDILRVDPKLGD